MGKTEKKNNYIKEIKKLIKMLKKQIFYEDELFFLNSRKIIEGLAIIKFQNDAYDFDATNDKALLEEIRKKQSEKIDNNYWENDYWEKYDSTKETLNSFAHFDLKNASRNSLYKDDINKILDKMIYLIKNNIDEIKKIKIDIGKLNVPEKISLLENNQTIKEKNILEIIDTNYIIPAFQRVFSWKEENFKKLFNDIEKNEDDFFDMGIFYVSVVKNESSLRIIDGQQRIYFLYILKNWISKSKFNNKKDEIREKNFTIKRKREGNSWKNNIDELNKEIEKPSDLFFINLKKEFNKLDNDEKYKKFKEKFKKIKINIKKVKKEEEVFYFNKINNFSENLSPFENIVTEKIYKFEKMNIENNEIYSFYNKYDLKNENEKKIINKIIEYVNNIKIKLDKYEIFISFLEKILNLEKENLYLKYLNYNKNKKFDWENIEKTLNEKKYEKIIDEIFIQIKYPKISEKEKIKLLMSLEFFESKKRKILKIENLLEIWANIEKEIEKKKEWKISDLLIFLVNKLIPTFSYSEIKKFLNLKEENHKEKIKKVNEILEKINLLLYDRRRIFMSNLRFTKRNLSFLSENNSVNNKEIKIIKEIDDSLKKSDSLKNNNGYLIGVTYLIDFYKNLISSNENYLKTNNIYEIINSKEFKKEDKEKDKIEYLFNLIEKDKISPISWKSDSGLINLLNKREIKKIVKENKFLK